MRIFYTTLPFFFSIPVFSQDSSLLKRTADQVEISEVVRLDSFPSSQLYFNAAMFSHEAFEEERSVAPVKDKKTKSVANRGAFPVVITNRKGDEIGARVVFTLHVQSEENSYRYTLSDLYFAFTEASGVTSYASFGDRRGLAMSPRQWQEVEDQTETFLRRFTAELKEQMVQHDVLCKEVLSMHKKRSREK